MTNNLPIGSINFRRLMIFTSGWILFLIFFGAIVRVTGSGMGCPDWPLCYNQIIPPAELPAWIEFLHRVIAGIAAILTFVIAVIAWRNYREYRSIYISAIAAVGLVLFQAFLGGVTVWYNNAPVTVIAHLITAVSYLALTLVITVVTHLPAEYVNNPGVPIGHKRVFPLFDHRRGVADGPAYHRRCGCGDRNRAGLHRLAPVPGRNFPQ